MRNLTKKFASRAVLFFIAVSPPIVSAWLMQLTTTETVEHYVDNKLLKEAKYLYQGSEQPLTFESCINVDYEDVGDNAKIDYFVFSRDSPTWDVTKTKEENMRDVVRGILFFEGANCDPFTVRLMYRLDDNYLPGNNLFLSSKPITPPLRVLSWRPMWLYGQGGYSSSLSAIQPGKFELFPPQQQLLQMIQRYQTTGANQQQIYQAPTDNQEHHRAQIDTGNVRLLTQQDPSGFTSTIPGTRRKAKSMETQTQDSSRPGQKNAQRNPRETENTMEILREKPSGEGEMSPKQLKLKQLEDQVDSLARLVNVLTAQKQSAQTRPELNQKFFEEEKEFEGREEPILFKSKNPVQAHQNNEISMADPNDISKFFSTFAKQNDPPTNVNKGFDGFFIPDIESQENTEINLSTPFRLSRGGTIIEELPLALARVENTAQTQRSNILEEQANRTGEDQSSTMMQEERDKSDPQPASSQRNNNFENGDENQNTAIEEIGQNETTEAQRQLDESISPQDRQQLQKGDPASMEMPPPSRPSRINLQVANANPEDVKQMILNNRLHYALDIQRYNSHYLDAMKNIFADSGKSIQETIEGIAQDPNMENRDLYLAEMKRLINRRKNLMEENENRYLEGLAKSAQKLRENDAKMLNSLAEQKSSVSQNLGTGGSKEHPQN